MMGHARWAAGLAMFCSLAGAQSAGCFFSPLESELTQGDATGGTGGYEPPACPGDPVADPALVRDDCGTFVSAKAAPGGNGTKAKPFVSFREAAELGAKRIYACAEVYDETAGVRFNGGVEVFAGFTECEANGAWRWDEGSKATLNGAANAVALTLSGGDNALRNLNVTAPAATAAGGSSVAVVIAGGKLSVNSGKLTAGDAKDGAPGVSPSDDPMLDGEPGAPGSAVCAGGANNPGPPGKTKTCSTGGQSVSGKGGDGGALSGSTLLAAETGGNGTPADPAEPTLGKGGTGEGQGSPAASVCAVGVQGAPGVVGGSGAGATGPGTLDVSGYHGGDGAPGVKGLPGQAGGGGGGARGGLNVTCSGQTSNRIGASGGAGGTGGCGGLEGTGGKAGGSSLALVVVDAEVTLTAVMLASGKAGNGGAAGSGQNGGAPGLGGLHGNGAGSAKQSCAGGTGGGGGPGGPGGGGQGGHSLGIAFQGATAPAGGEFMGGAAGTGGNGGDNNTTPGQGKGADGVAGECWDFATNAACSESASP